MSEWVGEWVSVWRHLSSHPIVQGPSGKLINFKGFAVGDGFPACIPQPGKPIDWCVDLNNVEFFRYPNALPGPFWDVEFFHGHSQVK